MEWNNIQNVYDFNDEKADLGNDSNYNESELLSNSQDDNNNFEISENYNNNIMQYDFKNLTHTSNDYENEHDFNNFLKEPQNNFNHFLLENNYKNNDNNHISSPISSNNLSKSTFSHSHPSSDKSNSGDESNNKNQIFSEKTMNQLSFSEKIRKKKEKTKKFLEKKKNRNINEAQTNLENINEENVNKNNFSNAKSKEELKMIRNRIAAQKSRDRKKQEFLYLQNLTKTLLKENDRLKNELISKNNHINELTKQLCDKCKGIMSKHSDLYSNEDIQNIIFDENQINTGLLNNSSFSKNKKMAVLLAGIIAVFCIFGMFAGSDLSEKNMRKLNEEKFFGVDKNKQIQVPFLIEKDYQKRHQYELNKIKKNLKNKDNLMVPSSFFKRNRNNYAECKKSDVNNNITLSNSTELALINNNSNFSYAEYNNCTVNSSKIDDKNTDKDKQIMERRPLNIYEDY